MNHGRVHQDSKHNDDGRKEPFLGASIDQPRGARHHRLCDKVFPSFPSKILELGRCDIVRRIQVMSVVVATSCVIKIQHTFIKIVI